ncbi:protein RecA [Rhizobium azibense]|nr:protein RecA [Rhizobium azibense]
MASAADIAASLAGAIGANDEEVTVSQFLPSGFPPLDHASNSNWELGAFPVGRMIEIAGPPSSGKTALATAAMAGAQQMGGIAGFEDFERSFSLRLAPRLGLDTTPGRFVFKTPKTFEEGLQLCVVAATHVRKNKLIKKDAPICWVFDSLASMVPQSAYYEMKNGKAIGVKSLEDRNMNDNTALARATSNAFPAFAQHVEELGICAIFLNQIRQDLNVKFGDPRKTTGGNAPAFYFSQRLWLSAAQIKKGTDIIGMEVTGKYMKNKIARPFQTATWRFMFQEDGTGKFDRQRSMVEFLETNGLLTKGKPGFVNFDGKQIAKETLARQIEGEGDKGFKKLMDLLPANYEPPVVAEVDTEVDEDATIAA